MIVILRNHDIARVANDIDNARIARIETLMALDDAGLGMRSKSRLVVPMGSGIRRSIFAQSRVRREISGWREGSGPGIAGLGNDTRKMSSGRMTRLRNGMCKPRARFPPAIKMLYDWNPHLDTPDLSSRVFAKERTSSTSVDPRRRRLCWPPRVHIRFRA